MREIKFRAWDKEKKEMRLDVTSFENECWTDIGMAGEHGEIEHFEIMEYTSFKDINGVEICEGDILENNGDNFNAVVEYRIDCETPGFYGIERKPKYARARYYEKKDGRIHTIPHLTCLPKVIGNIYENPELLDINHNR